MNKKMEELLIIAMNNLPLRNIMNIATCYGKQPLPVPPLSSDTPEQIRRKHHLNINAIYGKFAQPAFKGGRYTDEEGFQPLETVSAYPESIKGAHND
jgi:hypothetical protein